LTRSDPEQLSNLQEIDHFRICHFGPTGVAAREKSGTKTDYQIFQSHVFSNK
jgi:hypothetical protein